MTAPEEEGEEGGSAWLPIGGVVTFIAAARQACASSPTWTWATETAKLVQMASTMTTWKGTEK